MDNIFEKIFSLLELNKTASKEEFDDFINNLINHPTPIREACAFKLDELYCDDFIDEKNLEIILCAIIDINPNVSRNICALIAKNSLLQELMPDKIINKIRNILSELSNDEITSNNKSHKKNKTLFSLYWLLEALYYCNIKKYLSEILDIINVTILFNDYTIREKAAQLLTKIDNPPNNLVDYIRNDDNFYVNFYTTLFKN